MKKQNIEMLAEIRRIWRILTAPEVKHGFKNACFIVFKVIEANTPEHELWYSPGITEAELTENARVGDHLGFTRHLLGFTP